MGDVRNINYVLGLFYKAQKTMLPAGHGNLKGGEVVAAKRK